MESVEAQFLIAFERAAGDALDRGARMRVTRKGGDVTEGRVTSLHIHSGTGGYKVTSVIEQAMRGSLLIVEPEHYEPRECVVMIDNDEILGQEVAEFSVEGGHSAEAPRGTRI